jgi:hypothetical protein
MLRIAVTQMNWHKSRLDDHEDTIGDDDRPPD